MRKLETFIQHGTLGSLLDALKEAAGGYTLVDHWTQGEFHHDLVVRVGASALQGEVVVIATNCNGGVKELLAFDQVPDRWALWHARCPENPEFQGELPPIRDAARSEHWFDPCRLLTPDARSELLPACRRRGRGGGWEPLES